MSTSNEEETVTITIKRSTAEYYSNVVGNSWTDEAADVATACRKALEPKTVMVEVPVKKARRVARNGNWLANECRNALIAAGVGDEYE